MLIESYIHNNPDITDEAEIEAAVLEKYETTAEKVRAKAAKGGTFAYSAVDDWTIPVDYKHRMHENYCTLQESHILPCPAKRDAQMNYLGFDQAGVDKQPPGDGAFIYKNSWGSQNDKGHHHKRKVKVTYRPRSTRGRFFLMNHFFHRKIIVN